MKERIRIGFADFWPRARRDIDTNPLYRLLSGAFDLDLVDDPDFLIYSCFGREHLRYDCVRIFYTGENRRPDFKSCDYAFSFDFPESERNFRLPLYRFYMDDPESLEHRHKSGFSSRRLPERFCNFLYSNEGAPERIAFFRLLSEQARVDSGGGVLNNMGGRVDDKIEFLRMYRFTIAFENASWPGYTTEKILQAFQAGSIPIYWGNPLIDRDFNPDAFINCHDFDSFEDVVEHVRRVDADESLYRRYLAASVFPAGGPWRGVRDEVILERFRTIFSSGIRHRRGGRFDIIRYHAGRIIRSLGR
ncbi:MAG: glycosyltransferase [Rhodothermales bacterium]|nr:glycosyltransferase [Rhodothermales bacterium]